MHGCNNHIWPIYDSLISMPINQILYGNNVYIIHPMQQGYDIQNKTWLWHPIAHT